MMLEHRNFPLLVNSVTPLKKNYGQKGFFTNFLVMRALQWLKA